MGSNVLLLQQNKPSQSLVAWNDSPLLLLVQLGRLGFLWQVCEPAGRRGSPSLSSFWGQWDGQGLLFSRSWQGCKRGSRDTWSLSALPGNQHVVTLDQAPLAKASDMVKSRLTGRGKTLCPEGSQGKGKNVEEGEELGLAIQSTDGGALLIGGCDG